MCKCMYLFIACFLCCFTILFFSEKLEPFFLHSCEFISGECVFHVHNVDDYDKFYAYNTASNACSGASASGAQIYHVMRWLPAFYVKLKKFRIYMETFPHNLIEINVILTC